MENSNGININEVVFKEITKLIEEYGIIFFVELTDILYKCKNKNAENAAQDLLREMRVFQVEDDNDYRLIRFR